MVRSQFLVLAVLSFVACKTAPEPAEDVVEQYSDELQITDTVVGTGETAVAGMTVTVHYRGTLTDGQVFDSSFNREPLTFKLGARRVIRGWDQGLVGMKVGGKRTLIIPPRLAYGSKSVGQIPPNSHLIFDVELLQVTP
ncbi:MAG: FKBP-type peptidyl-prolyl cis-trans isomerase [Myxococcota bacterium]